MGAGGGNLGQHRVLLHQGHVAQIRGVGPYAFIEIVTQQAIGWRMPAQ